MEGSAVNALIDLLVAELRPLTPAQEARAAELFAEFLQSLEPEDTDPVTPPPPRGNLPARERILCIVEHHAPGLRDSPAGPSIERTLNAILLHVADLGEGDSNPGTVTP